ncbi:adhesion G-protein coupled receptor G7 isoform X2 [Brienomyrus brachyistius]|uniref:adhesion G-protein coupled receptor G7 isoform X2 n=2 Tax=Brienomyrus brachyistius TaxID=42636 RepID=UPI0020B32FDA|nr:adhesion G-protein coupled receptor G7 isoform X2 [Brienomyrus brachyistius]
MFLFSTANFCNATKMGRFTFNKTAVGWFSYSNELCTSSEGSTGLPKATTQCTNDNGRPTFQRAQTFRCGTSLGDLQQMINSTNASTIAISTQILTSKPETLTAENITMAAKITTTLLLGSSLKEAINFTVVTISQLLKASRSEFSSQTSSVIESLTSALENFTLTVGSSQSETVVQPNLAMKSLKVNVSHGAAQGIQFSATPSTTQSFVSDRIYTSSVPQLTINKTTPTGVNIFIKFPQERTQEAMKVGFVLYQNDKFFQSRRFATPLGTTRNVITGSISSDTVGLRKTVPEFVELLYQPPPIRNATLYDFACVFWDYSLGDWSTEGCFKSNRLSETDLARGMVGCVCNHTTSFSMLLSFRKDVKYSKAMDIITFVGCFLSVIALSATILLELIVSKSRKSNTTMILVSIYSSLLLFNLLFIFGANKPPVVGTVMADRSGNHMLKSDLHVDRDSGPCTAVTALMHFFLLATFTWNALYAMQMLLTNLRRTQLCSLRLSQSRFTVISLIVGWGFPLVLTSFTLAVSYSVENPLNYRQQEFCWLATMDENGTFDPRRTLLWSFLLPVAVLLFFNTVELVYFSITAVRQARRTRRRSKTKTNNSCTLLKEVISSISLAVLLGLTWLIGYLLLVSHDPDVHTVLSIIFCVFNTTQGIQIFLLIPDWGRISTALRSMPTPTVSIGLHSKKYNVRAQHGKGLPEVYRKMETDFTSNFHILSPSSNLPKEKET